MSLVSQPEFRNLEPGLFLWAASHAHTGLLQNPQYVLRMVFNNSRLGRPEPSLRFNPV